MRAGRRPFDRARQLRREMSLPEVILWDCLRGKRLEGLRFRRQHPVSRYILDFYCVEARLAVEVDGAHHDLPDGIARDAVRDAWLAEQGIRVSRFPVSDVLDDAALDGVLRGIAAVARGE